MHSAPMSLVRVTPEEAKALLDAGDHLYLDVRSVPEFEAGHAPGALNIPILHRGPTGLSPNPDFVAVVRGCIPTDQKLVVACASGVRSQDAGAVLMNEGYELVEMQAGFNGERGPMGSVTLEGWAGRGYPVTSDAGDGDYSVLEARSKEG